MSLTVCVHSQARQFIQLDFPHSSPNVQVTCDVSERMERFPCELKLVFRPRTTVGVWLAVRCEACPLPCSLQQGLH